MTHENKENKEKPRTTKNHAIQENQKQIKIFFAKPRKKNKKKSTE